MTDKEKILMYEASNLFLQKYFPFIMPEWLSELNAKILARRFKRKWMWYQRAIETNEFMKQL
tara:strand:+ start:6182 stop:6367 length:186 start_codon:yes stop_codon:yes gene_type:complete